MGHGSTRHAEDRGAGTAGRTDGEPSGDDGRREHHGCRASAAQGSCGQEMGDTQPPAARRLGLRRVRRRYHHLRCGRAVRGRNARPSRRRDLPRAPYQARELVARPRMEGGRSPSGHPRELAPVANYFRRRNGSSCCRGGGLARGRSHQACPGMESQQAVPAGKFERPAAVRRELEPILRHAGFGSRLKISHKELQATSVLTLVKKLAKMTDDERFTDWYDWLSDAAHPALGARIAFASPPIAHDTGAEMIRWYARVPMTLEGGGKREHLEPTIAFTVAYALIAAGTVIADVLQQSLAVVDDMGLTTAAATLTRRVYWRNFSPVRGNSPCPCGRGRASVCRHYWGQPAPVVNIPTTAGAAS